MTFETFVPKNIEKHQADLDKINAEKPAKFQAFVKEFTANLKTLQGKHVADTKEQVFIDLMQNLVIDLEPLRKYAYSKYIIFMYRPENFKGEYPFYTFYYRWD